MSLQSLLVELLALLAAGYFLREGLLSFRKQDGCSGGSCANCSSSAESGVTRKVCGALPVRSNQSRP